MRDISRWTTAIAALLIVSAPQGAKAGMVGMSRAALAPIIQHMAFDPPTPANPASFCDMQLALGTAFTLDAQSVSEWWSPQRN